MRRVTRLWTGILLLALCHVFNTDAAGVRSMMRDKKLVAKTQKSDPNADVLKQLASMHVAVSNQLQTMAKQQVSEAADSMKEAVDSNLKAGSALDNYYGWAQKFDEFTKSTLAHKTLHKLHDKRAQNFEQESVRQEQAATEHRAQLRTHADLADKFDRARLKWRKLRDAHLKLHSIHADQARYAGWDAEGTKQWQGSIARQVDDDRNQERNFRDEARTWERQEREANEHANELREQAAEQDDLIKKTQRRLAEQTVQMRDLNADEIDHRQQVALDKEKMEEFQGEQQHQQEEGDNMRARAKEFTEQRRAATQNSSALAEQAQVADKNAKALTEQAKTEAQQIITFKQEEAAANAQVEQLRETARQEEAAAPMQDNEALAENEKAQEYQDRETDMENNVKEAKEQMAAENKAAISFSMEIENITNRVESIMQQYNDTTKWAEEAKAAASSHEEAMNNLAVSAKDAQTKAVEYQKMANESQAIADSAKAIHSHTSNASQLLERLMMVEAQTALDVNDKKELAQLCSWAVTECEKVDDTRVCDAAMHPACKLYQP